LCKMAIREINYSTSEILYLLMYELYVDFESLYIEFIVHI